MSTKRRATGLGLVAVATLGVAACKPFDPQDAGGAPSVRPAAQSAAPGVPSGPPFYRNPEPTFVATDPPASPAPASGAPLPILVTYAQWNPTTKSVELAGLVSGPSEATGTCTAMLSRAGSEVTGTTAATPDASSTSCGGLSIPGAKLSSGTWKAVVSYRSPKHTGISQPVQVVVP